MFSEPQTPSTCVGYSFSETKPPVFGIGPSALSEASRIQATLHRRLGPEYVSQRPAPGGGPKLTYVEGWKIIGLANEVFGYNGWCSTVTKIETDFLDMDSESRRYSVGVTAIVKVTLKDGTYHEDVGYGTGENLKSKGAALDKAKKEAVTDGVKRALRNFGNLLGLCLYEKSFTREVVKIKAEHPKFDESDLHRRTGSVSTMPSAGSLHDVSLTTSTEPLSAISSISPQIRPVISKTEPPRNPILNAKTLFEDEQGLASGSRTRVDTTGVRPAQFKHQTSRGNRIAPQSNAPSFHPDRPLLHQPQQGSSTSASSSRQCDTRSVEPPALKVSDSDPDIYFNDEDNEAFLAIEDSLMHDVGALAAAGDSAQSRVCSVGRDVEIESSSSAVGTRPSIATTVVSTSNRIPAPPQDQPMSVLRQAIRASTGVKRPAEVLQSHYPQSIGTSSAQQQQRLAGNNGRREPLSDLPIQGDMDVKRIKR